MRALVACCCALACSVAAAQGFPSGTVRIVIGVSAGGLSDVLARALAQELTRGWGQSVIVENRVGGADIIATSYVAKSQPDGLTILQTAADTWMANRYLRKNLPYDEDKDFTPVLGAIRTNSLLIAGEKSPIKSLRDLVELAKAKPGTLFYGSFGIASSQHLMALEFDRVAGIETTHIPYKGGADVIRALLSKNIDFSFTAITPALPVIKTGQVRALGYGGDRRWPGLPDVPTMAEAGFPLKAGSWLGWFVPAATPKDVVEKIAADAIRILTTPAFRDRYVYGAGLDELAVGPAQLSELLAETRKSYLARIAPLKLEPQ